MSSPGFISETKSVNISVHFTWPGSFWKLCAEIAPRLSFYPREFFCSEKIQIMYPFYGQAKQQAFFVPSRLEVALKTLQNLAQLVVALIIIIFLLLFN